MRKRMRTGLALAMVGLMALGVSACSERASSTSDTHVCVFDGSEKGGQKLRYQIPPGAKSKEIDDNDQVVKIPASNRFWNVTSDRNIADPGTPSGYTGNATGGVPVRVEGTIRFRFNLELACQWYSQHGRRNANGDDLGFNKRGEEALEAGWFKFLNENFTVTMQEVVSEELSNYKWNYLHYNFPDNAGEDGTVPDGVTPGPSARQKLGNTLGAKFTERLRANLGDAYFCGINAGEEVCPDMEFQISYAGPGGDSTLVTDRAKVESTRQALETSRLEGQLQQEQLGQTLAAEEAKRKILEVKAVNAELQAAIDTAKCRKLAEQGLDCEGKRPQPIVSG